MLDLTPIHSAAAYSLICAKIPNYANITVLSISYNFTRDLPRGILSLTKGIPSWPTKPIRNGGPAPHPTKPMTARGIARKAQRERAHQRPSRDGCAVKNFNPRNDRAHRADVPREQRAAGWAVKISASRLTQISNISFAVSLHRATVLRVRPAIGRPQGWRCRAPAFGG